MMHPEPASLSAPVAPPQLYSGMLSVGAQVVVLLVQHGPTGSVGLILNRPSGLRLAMGRGGLPMPVVGAPEGMQEVFADNRLYCGGLVRQDVSVLVLHWSIIDMSICGVASALFSESRVLSE